MPVHTSEVDLFISTLSHPLKDVVAYVRDLILDSKEGVTEHIKWNAPSFCFEGEDRVTFNLRDKEALTLVFHRGAKVKDAAGFLLEDKNDQLSWASADRATMKIKSLEEMKKVETAFQKTVSAWMDAASK